MKHAVLTSVAHNIGTSLASGCGLMVGVYEMNVFGEAACSPEGFIEVDFLTGDTSGATPSVSLGRAIRLYVDALPELCKRHGCSLTDFERLTVKYLGKVARPQFVVEITDRNGQTSADRYVGYDGARPMVLDARGRVTRLRSA